MLAAIRQLIHLARRTDKIWLVPLFLAFVILVFVIIGAQISAVPIFLYPFI